MGNTAETGLSATELRDLSDIAGTMIPESPAFGVPGADDPAILGDIARSLGRDLPLVREALAAIAAKSGSAFTGMDRDRREALINDYYAGGGAAVPALARVVRAPITAMIVSCWRWAWRPALPSRRATPCNRETGTVLTPRAPHRLSGPPSSPPP